MRADSRDNEGPESTAADLLTGQGELMLFMGCEVKGAQSCLTLCDPMDSTAHGILQARILERVAFPFSQLRD